MTVHADDIAITIRRALGDKNFGAQAETQGDVRITPNPEQGWPNRDGRLEFLCIGRDWVRAFRISVESVPLEDFDHADDGDRWIVITEAS